MLIIAHHHISNPEGFWKAAKENTQNLPAPLKLHGVYPSQDQKMATCIWEGDSAEEIQDFVDKFTSEFAKNYCYEVNAKESMGLPLFNQVMEHAN
jgi:hypothetical protein